jgi:hypothetical protein
MSRKLAFHFFTSIVDDGGGVVHVLLLAQGPSVVLTEVAVGWLAGRRILVDWKREVGVGRNREFVPKEVGRRRRKRKKIQGR